MFLLDVLCVEMLNLLVVLVSVVVDELLEVVVCLMFLLWCVFEGIGLLVVGFVDFVWVVECCIEFDLCS